MKAILKRQLPIQVLVGGHSKRHPCSSYRTKVWKTVNEHEVEIVKQMTGGYLVKWMGHELVAFNKEMEV